MSDQDDRETGATPAWPTPRRHGPTPPTPPPPVAPTAPPTVPAGPAPFPGAPTPAPFPPGPPTGPHTAPPPGPHTAPPPPPGYPGAAAPGGYGATPPPGAPPPGYPPNAFAGTPPPAGAPAPAAGRSRKGLALAVVGVGVLAVAAVGVLGVRALTGGGGGASSPEAAVEQLAGAIEEEDLLAALDVLDPDEVDALVPVVEAAQGRAEELGFAPEASTFGGIDVSITGAEYRVDQLGDGVARVRLAGGSADVDVERSALGRLSEAITGLDDEEPFEGGEVAASDLELETEAGTVDPFLVVVERGGRWYVSPAYTAAQYVVEAFGLDDAEIPAPDAGDGADDAEAAVRALLEGAGAVDGRQVGDAVAGPLGAVVRAYADPFEQVVGGDVDDVTTTIDTLDTSVEDREGGGQRVVVDALEGTVSWTSSDGDGSSTVSWDGTCLDVGDVSDDDAEGGETVGGDHDFCLTQGWERIGIDQLAVVAVEDGGSWRVDPVATVADYAEAVVPDLTEAVVLRALDVPDAIAPSAELAQGDRTDVDLNEAGYAVVTFDAADGDRFTVAVSSEDDDDEVLATVIDPDGERLSAFSVIDAIGGTYRLLLGTEAWAAGRLSVAVSPVASEDIAVGDTVDGSIEAGSVVEYSVDLDLDATYVLAFDNEDLVVDVYDPDDLLVELSEDAEADPPTDTFTALVSGTYKIRVDGGFSGATGSYSLTLDQGEPFVLGNGSSPDANGTLTGPDDEQYIDLLVRAGREVRADITTTTPELDMVVILRDPETNEEIDRFDDAGPGEGEAISFTPDVDTTWRIAVQGKNDTTGDFVVEATLDE